VQHNFYRSRANGRVLQESWRMCDMTHAFV